MKIELLYFEGCPGYERALPALRAALRAADVDDDIELRAVETVEEAEKRRFLGSPTIRVDGQDVEPGAAERTDFGLKCRLYRDAGSATGQPSEELIREALARATGRRQLK